MHRYYFVSNLGVGLKVGLPMAGFDKVCLVECSMLDSSSHNSEKLESRPRARVCTTELVTAASTSLSLTYSC
eukprot:40235-Amphidinium_carterae.1